MSLVVTWLILSLYFTPTHQYVTQDVETWGCQGTEITNIACTDRSAVLVLKSITVVSSSNTDRIIEAGTKCTQVHQVHECQRRISGGSADSGLSADYKFFYDYSVHACVGKNACSSLSLPQWWALTGDSVVPYILDAKKESFNRTCPKEGVKYFSGALYDFECRAGEEIKTVTAPADTTPRTRPTTPTTTTSFPVIFAVYMPALANREKVILGIAIGMAIAILLVLLLILYCWDSWRKQKKFGKLLRLLGGPSAMDDGFDELRDYGTADAWKTEAENADALGEYTGVKPDEFMTIDRKTMEKSGLIFSDQTGTMTMTGRGNTASTLTKGGGYGRPHGRADPRTGHTGPVDYETAENLELERRMAAALEDAESET